MNAFLPADILMPKTDHMEKWAVIACDQFTSDQAYWDRVRKNAEGAVSTINLILPEAELGTEKEAEHTAEINATMKKYMDEACSRPIPTALSMSSARWRTAPSARALSAWSISMPMTIPPARPAPSAPPSAPCPSASRRVSVSAATLPLSCRMC